MAENDFLLFDCVLINFWFEHMDSFWLCFCYGDFCIFELVLLFSFNSLCSVWVDFVEGDVLFVFLYCFLVF